MIIWLMQQDPNNWHHHHGWDTGWWMLVGGGMWLLLLVAIMVAVIVLVRGAQTQRSVTRDDALELVRRRYAQGELSREEFEQLRADLQH